MIDPAIAKFLAALEETQYLAPERMEAYQRRLLDRLLRHARSQTAFYADRLAPLFRPDDSIDWDRWTDIPILTRKEAQANADALFARTVPPAAGETVTAFTSGSTGRALPPRHLGPSACCLGLLQRTLQTLAQPRPHPAGRTDLPRWPGQRALPGRRSEDGRATGGHR